MFTDDHYKSQAQVTLLCSLASLLCSCTHVYVHAMMQVSYDADQCADEQVDDNAEEGSRADEQWTPLGEHSVFA